MSAVKLTFAAVLCAVPLKEMVHWKVKAMKQTKSSGRTLVEEPTIVTTEPGSR